ncbi:MAG TPA: hypothetical protein VFU94_13535 [Conexibacter sp.]|nr:hypothetical protein [Conexibacter sp.]
MYRGIHVPPLAGRANRALARTALAALCAALVALASAATASAAGPTSAGSFDCNAISCSIGKLAVDESTGDIYMIDANNDAVDKFDASGNLLSQIRGSSTTSTTFSFGGEDDIAVDNTGGPNQGNVYVVSEGGGSSLAGKSFFAFNSSGTELWEAPSIAGDACGISVDPSGNPWGSDFSGQVAQMRASDGGLTGTRVATPGFQSCETAFDTTGNLYVVNWTTTLEKFDAAGNHVGTVDGTASYDVATDTATNDVYDVVKVAPGDWEVDAFNASGSALAGTPFDTNSAQLRSVAVDSRARIAYVADSADGLIQIFDLPPLTHTLTVTVNGTGSGSVDADSGAIAGCTRSGGTCSGPYAGSVTLTPTPAAHTSVSWTGCDSVTVDNRCVVTVNADMGVTATFTTIQHTLRVTKSGSGSGTVTSSPAGISCGGTCSALFDEGSTVRLTATPAAGSTFAGWSGGGCSGAGTCSPAINADTTVTAAFTLNGPSAVTGSASGISQTAATIGGSVNPNGNATSCHFDYGTTTAYGSTAPCASSPGGGSSSVSVSASLSGLAAGTTYHFRLVASSDGGTSTGADATFTTTPPANATLKLASHTASIKGSVATVKVSCTGDAGATCKGKVTFKATIKIKVKKGHKTVVKKKTITVGSASYDLAAGSSGKLSIKLSSAAKSALAKGSLTAKASGLSGSVKLPKIKVKKHKK